MQQESYGSVHDGMELINDQISVLKNLKNAPYLLEDLPKIPFCDFKSIVKHVKKERLKKKSDLKWERFIANKARKVSDKSQDQRIELKSINFEDSPDRFTYVNAQQGLSPNLLLERKGFDKSDLYFILKHVKRERKKLQDEEHWRNFNKLIINTEQKLPKNENILCKNYTPKTVVNKLCNHTSHGVDKACSPILPKSENEASNKEVPCCPTLKEEPNVEIQNVKRKLNVLKKEIENLLNNINTLYKDCLNNSGDISDEMKNQALEFTLKFERDFLRDLDNQVKHLRTFNPNNWATSTYIVNTIGIFQTLLHALQVIERQLQVNSYIYPLKDVLSLFLNISYSLMVFDKYFIGDNERQSGNIEILILQILNLLHTLSPFRKENIEITKEHLPSEKSSDITHCPSLQWIDKSEALAFIKFGPPNQINNHLNDKDKATGEQTPNQEILAKDQEVAHKLNGVKNHSNNFASGNLADNDTLNDDVTKKKSVKRDEALSKIIAKKIQEISGVEGELKKIEEVRIKMMSTLLNIKVIISKNYDFNSMSVEEDFERIQQRTIEFGARFKRNYLYRTKCQLTELKSNDCNPLLINKKSKVVAVLQKLSLAHQGVLQSLQVIEKQLQTISVIGLTQEVFFAFYHCIYELTFLLKPFYGFSNTEALDEVEKLVLDTTKLLRDLKQEQELAARRKPSAKTEAKTKPKLKLGKDSKLLKKDKLSRKKSPYANKLVKKQSKQSVVKNEDKPVEENKEEKSLQFMMNIKQRPGAEVRLRGRTLQQDPKTMVEMLAESESNSDASKYTDFSRNCSADMSSASSEELIKPNTPLSIPEEQIKLKPPNVKLITITRVGSADEEREDSIEKNSNQKEQVTEFWTDLTKYKEEFKMFKRSNPLYNKKSLLTVKGMTDKLMDEALSESLTKVLNTINVQDISALKDILEEEIK